MKSTRHCCASDPPQNGERRTWLTSAVMGHTARGAIKGAIDNVELGNLTGLLATIKPAVAATQYSGERSSKNAAFVDAVARSNVKLTIDTIRSGSPILADLEKQGKIRIVRSMYNLANGAVTFME
jgi:carbonic anhydrase